MRGSTRITFLTGKVLQFNAYRDPKKFWTTTGLYPQEVLIDLGGTKSINDVKFSVSGARKIIIEGCKNTTASEFKKVGESKGMIKGCLSHLDLANKPG